MVKTNPTLYGDRQLKITYLLDQKGKITSIEDHELWILDANAQTQRYILPRSTLKEFARTPRDKLEQRLENLHPGIYLTLRNKTSLTIDSIGVAIAQAYIEELRRLERAR